MPMTALFIIIVISTISVIAIKSNELLFWQRLIAGAFSLLYTSNITPGINSVR